MGSHFVEKLDEFIYECSLLMHSSPMELVDLSKPAALFLCKNMITYFNPRGDHIQKNDNKFLLTGTWSPTIPLIKLIAPLRQSLSVSAENLPRPRQMAAGMRKPWPYGAKATQVSKCQSID